jgi:hypothetical protein
MELEPSPSDWSKRSGYLTVEKQRASLCIAEIGDKRLHLKSGDSILGPREVPHVRAFVGEAPGRLLIAVAPANRMEEYFGVIEKVRGGRYSTWNNPEDKERMRAFGIELLGPPLSIDWTNDQVASLPFSEAG